MGFFFFKQKTAYEMRISDWSSDVCSSDLLRPAAGRGGSGQHARRRLHGRDRPRAPPHRRPGVLIMAKPQQPELRRSGFVPALDPDATESRLDAHERPGTSAPGGPVPEDQRPGHHPDDEQDKPDLAAVAARHGLVPDHQTPP